MYFRRKKFVFCRTSDGEDLDDDDSESPLEDASKEPELIMPLRNKIGVSGSDLKLACRVYCPVKMNVEWFKDNKPIDTENQRLSIEVQDELYTIHISKLRLSDAGLYTAVFKNRYGTAETKSELTVEGS